MVKPKPRSRQSAPAVDWNAVAVGLAKAMTPEVRQTAAGLLGLPPSGLDCIRLLGRGSDDSGRFVSFPETDGQGAVVGVCRRYRDKKLQMPGGGRGITVPVGFEPEKAEVVLVVEGPSDVAALRSAGVWAVGRPSNVGGVAHLAYLLQKCRPGCRIVVVGENDRKSDGDWPGLVGAVTVAEQLGHSLQRRPGLKRAPVGWSLCPSDAKDVRAFLTARLKPDAGQVHWHSVGMGLQQLLLDSATSALGRERDGWALMAENAELKRRLSAVEEMMRKLAEKV